MNAYTWETTFRQLFENCCERYRSGDEDFENYYSEEDLEFLNSIGCQKRELFDFVEDHVDEAGGQPSLETALLIAAVRRDFFLTEQGGQQHAPSISPEQLPGRKDQLGGLVWLPRIITKARGKLEGELDPNIMFGCGGDRAFLKPLGIHPADFLHAVWRAGSDDAKILAYVEEQKE